MSVRARFQKMADDVRLIIPEVDDPFWNFYRNSLSGGARQPAAIRIVFKRNDREVADATFQCLPSPQQLAWVALDRTLATHPRLRWDSVAINNGTAISREKAMGAVNADPLVRHARSPARSAFDLLTQFNRALQAIDIQQAAPDAVRQAYGDAKARFAAHVCAAAYDVEWKRGGPGLLGRLAPMLGR